MLRIDSYFYQLYSSLLDIMINSHSIVAIDKLYELNFVAVIRLLIFHGLQGKMSPVCPYGALSGGRVIFNITIYN